MRKNSMKWVSRRSGLVLAVAALTAASSAYGQTWTGLAGTGLFSSSGNWDTLLTPVSDPSTSITFGGSTNISATLDLGAFTLGQLTLGNSGTTLLGADSASTFTFGGAAPTILMAGSGNSTISAPVFISGTLAVSGAGTGALTLSGPVSSAATGGVVKSSAGDLNFTGSGSSFGFLQVNAGTASISGDTFALTTATGANGAGASDTGGVVALTVGNVAGQSAVLNLTGAVINSNSSVFAGNKTGATGTINIVGGSLTTNLTTFANGRVGVYSGTGNFNVSGGASVTGLSFELGRGTGAITASSTWSGSGTTGTFQQVLVGGVANENASLSVLDGAAFTLSGVNSFNIGAGASSVSRFLVKNATANVTVNGGTSSFSIGGGSAAQVYLTVDNSSLTIGSSTSGNTTLFGMSGTGSVGTFSFVNGGKLVLSKSNPQFGQGANSVCLVNIDGAGSGISTTGSGTIFAGVGAGSLTTINLTNGGTINSTLQTGNGSSTTVVNVGAGSSINATMNLGAAAGATSTVNLNGGNYTGNVQTGFAADTNTINVGAGSTLTSPSFLYLGTSIAASNNYLNVLSGGTVAMTGQLQVGAAGQAKGNMTVAAGGAVIVDFAGLMTVGNGTGGYGGVLVDGGLLYTDASTVLGTSFTGANADGSNSVLVVRNGGTATFNGTVYEGRNVVGSGAMTSSVVVTGAGSTLSSVLTFNVGYSRGSNSSLLVTNGASATFGALTIGAISASSATDAFATGSVTFSGSGTQVSGAGVGIGAASFSHGSLSVTSGATATFTGEVDVAGGLSSVATLLVSGGSSVSMTGNLFTSFRTNASAGVTVTGAGTTLTVGGVFEFSAGNGTNVGGASTLLISSGAKVSTGAAFFGLQPSTTFTGVVDAASFATTQISMNNNAGSTTGTGSLTVRNGGTVTVSGGVFVGGTSTVSLTGGSLLQATLFQRGDVAGISQLSVDATSRLLLQGTNTGTATIQAVVGGAGVIELNNPQLTEFFDVSPFPFTGTLRATAGTFSIGFVGWKPNVSNAGTGTAEALSSTGKIVDAHDVTFGTTTPRVGLQVHVARATGGGTILVSNSADGSLTRLLVTDLVDVGPSAAYTGLIDLTNNDMVVRSSGQAAVASEIAAYFNGGRTVGIGTSRAGSELFFDDRDMIATLGYLTNSDGAGGALYSTFDGLPITSSDVVVKYTYIGDTNLDGVVDGADLQNLLAGMNGGLNGWVNGDLNYDGVVNGVDLSLLLNSLSSQGASFGNPFGGGGSGAVPEPAGLLPLALAGTLASRRRRR